MSYEWVLLDADGTLFDYDEAERYALEATLQDFELAFDEGTVEVYRRINGALWLDFEEGKIEADRLKVLRFERLLAAMGAGVSDPAWFSAVYLRHLGGVCSAYRRCSPGRPSPARAGPSGLDHQRAEGGAATAARQIPARALFRSDHYLRRDRSVQARSRNLRRGVPADGGARSLRCADRRGQSDLGYEGRTRLRR